MSRREFSSSQVFIATFLFSVPRFANRLLEVAWNKESISSVLISLKEQTHDLDQRSPKMFHLLHLMALVCMEPKADLEDKDIAEAKLKVLQCIQPPAADDLVLGQVQTDAGQQQHLDYAAVSLKVKNDRWDGVPFILRSGTGMDEFKEEMRIQLKPSECYADMNDLLNGMSLQADLACLSQPAMP